MSLGFLYILGIEQRILLDLTSVQNIRHLSHCIK